MIEGLEEELLGIFREEAAELLAKLSKALLALEVDAAGPNREGTLRELFRLAHTVKGSAATVGRTDFAELAHGLESCLDGVRRGAIDPGQALVTAALQVTDILEEGIRRPLQQEEIHRGRRDLETATRSLQRAAGPEGAPPSAPLSQMPPPVALAALEVAAPAPAVLEQAMTSLMGELTAITISPGAEPLAEAFPLVEQVARGVSASRPLSVRVAGALREAFVRTVESGRPPGPLVDASFLALDFLQTDQGAGGSEDEAAAVEAALRHATAIPGVATSSSPAPSQSGVLVPAPDSAASATEGTVRIPVLLLDSILYRLDELAAIRLRLDYQRRLIEDDQDALDATLQRGRLDGARTGDARPLLSEVERHKRRLETIRRDLSQEVHQLGVVAQGLLDDVKDVRMVPVGPALDPLRRAVRDLAQAMGKDATLELEGEHVRVDKRLLELLRDPLTHLLRNAVDHGIERPDVRRAAGKSPRGKIRIKAESRESQVVFEIRDDGQGISVERVRQVALQRGLLDAERVKALTTREALNLIFAPGFSTATGVTEISGRGVGLDVVRENVARLGGRIEFFTEDGKGTQFNLSVPLTLTASRGLLVTAGRLTFCIPLTAVEEAITVDPVEVGVVQGGLAVHWRRQAIAYAGLEDLLLGRPCARPPRRGPIAIIALSERRLALGVDELIGQEEMVLKGLAAGTPRLPFVAGAINLPDGRLITVLEPAALMEAAAGTTVRAGPGARPDRALTVLVVDDALTTRTLVASVLERAGYRTRVAPDGERALAALAAEQIDLVVSDVEMPGLDGFALTRTLRGTEQSGIPVILLTSIDTPEDRARGAEAGANGYLVKQRFDSVELLGMVADLVGEPGGGS